jgi:hypothetical protein
VESTDNKKVEGAMFHFSQFTSVRRAREWTHEIINAEEKVSNGTSTPKRSVLRILTVVEPPFVIYDEKEKLFYGFLIDFLRKLSSDLEFEYELYSQECYDDISGFGRPDQRRLCAQIRRNVTYDSAISLTGAGLFDAVWAAHYMTSARLTHHDESEGGSGGGVRFMTPTLTKGILINRKSPLMP